ncbi:MAG: hypothetical protein FWG20_01300 [Candidatus Cloacimonetes bacterium]|nr:hypothetical protein [Candidatus Cloacimonadota bacterium]
MKIIKSAFQRMGIFGTIVLFLIICLLIVDFSLPYPAQKTVTLFLRPLIGIFIIIVLIKNFDRDFKGK